VTYQDGGRVVSRGLHLVSRAATLVFAAAAAMVVATAAPAPAATTDLNGESFTSPSDAAIVGGACNPTGYSTFQFKVSGIAAGPLGGTFTETGSFSIGPQTEEFAPGQFRGPIAVFEAHFSITGSTGHGRHAEGDKTLVVDPGNHGVCTNSGAAQSAQVHANTRAHSVVPSVAPGTGHASSVVNLGAATQPGTASAPRFQAKFTCKLPPPVAPEAPYAVLLPGAALLVGSVVVVGKRRRNRLGAR
jgi:hypothetical protein